MTNPQLIHVFADYGAEAPETTVSKALLQGQFPGSAQIFSQPGLQRGHVTTAAIFLQMVLPSFNPGTIHLCDISHNKLSPKAPAPYLAAVSNNQWFMAPDNGFLPLVLQNQEVTFYSLPTFMGIRQVIKDIYIPSLQTLIADNFTPRFAEKENPIKSMLFNPSYQNNFLRLVVVYNDAQGNAIFNLKRDEFERMRNGRRIRISVSSYRLEIDRMSESVFEVEQGYSAAVFGLGDFLQISMNAGSAKQYYGLVEGSVIMLEFID